MLQWVCFIVLNAVMFYAFTLVASEVISSSSGCPASSMNGQFLLIAPVSIAGPLVADCIFLDSAIFSFQYGWLGVVIFMTYYFAYIAGGIRYGSALAKRKLCEATETETKPE